MGRHERWIVATAVAVVAVAVMAPGAGAQEGAASAPVGPGAAPLDASREARLRTLLTGVRLVGRFTIDAAPASPREPAAGPPAAGEPASRDEEYRITSVAKLGTGDWWTVLARIRYGSVDVTLPVPVEVKWAGETPVITLDKATLPGLGTFSSRVVLDGDRYAGTWQHDAVGGHMFGRIVRGEDPAADAPPRPTATQRPDN